MLRKPSKGVSHRILKSNSGQSLNLIKGALILAILTIVADSFALTKKQFKECLKSDLEIIAQTDCTKSKQPVAFLMSGLSQTLSCVRGELPKKDCALLLENSESASHIVGKISEAESCDDLRESIDPYYAQFGADLTLRNFCADSDVILSFALVTRVRQFLQSAGYVQAGVELSSRHPYAITSMLALMVRAEQLGPTNTLAVIDTSVGIEEANSRSHVSAKQLNDRLQNIIQNEQISRATKIYNQVLEDLKLHL